MNRLLLFIPAVLLFFSCRQEKKRAVVRKEQKQVVVEEKKDDLKPLKPGSAKIFRAKEIGWAAPLPEGWNILVSNDTTRMNARRRKENNKSFAIRDPDFEPLLSVRKNTFNSFSSHIRKIDGENEGSYDERTTTLFNKLKHVYSARGKKIKETIGAELIDDIMFDRLELELLDPETSNTLVYQTLYSAHINGYDFSMLITYDNGRDQYDLMGLVDDSKFSIKKQAP